MNATCVWMIVEACEGIRFPGARVTRSWLVVSYSMWALGAKLWSAGREQQGLLTAESSLYLPPTLTFKKY